MGAFMAEKIEYTNEEILDQLRDFLKRNGNIFFVGIDMIF